MTKPLPWSHSALEDFLNCGRAYYEKRVAKSVKEQESEAIIWGNIVHKAFENYIAHGTELPPDLADHKPYLDRLKAHPGERSAELKIALDNTLKPCHSFAPNVWFRGVIDLDIDDGDRALLADYKTGKPHNKKEQLQLFAIYKFHASPDIQVVDTQYYWTQTRSVTGQRYVRSDLQTLWAGFIPKLKAYKAAFDTDTWTPKPSGLCGWCPVEKCEFWRPRRKK